MEANRVNLEELLRPGREAYELRNLQTEEDGAVVDAVATARQRQEADAEREQAQFRDRLHGAANLLNGTHVGNVLAVINSDTVKARLQRDLDTVRRQKAEEADKALLEVTRARFLDPTKTCEQEKADGSLCGKPLGRRQIICKDCRAYETRMPPGITFEAWEAEKKWRAAARKREREERRERNQTKLKEKKEQRQKKRAKADGAGQAVAVAAVVNTMSSQPGCFMCPEPLMPGHAWTCNECKAITHDTAECIRAHEESCPGS